jgi:ribosomal protein S25
MANDLIGYPVITVPMMAKNYEVTYPAANAAVSKLVEVGVLREATGRRYARIFVASEVLRIIEDR